MEKIIKIYEDALTGIANQNDEEVKYGDAGTRARNVAQRALSKAGHLKAESKLINSGYVEAPDPEIEEPILELENDTVSIPSFLFDDDAKDPIAESSDELNSAPDELLIISHVNDAFESNGYKQFSLNTSFASLITSNIIKIDKIWDTLKTQFQSNNIEWPNPSDYLHFDTMGKISKYIHTKISMKKG